MRRYILGTFNIILLVFTALFFISCATKGLPSPENAESTLLVVNVKYETVMKKSFLKYRLIFDNGSFITIYPKHGNKYISQLTPGNYKVVGFQADYLDSNKLGSRTKTNINFTLEPGKITIFPVVFNVFLKNTKMETGVDLTQLISLTDLSDIQRDEIMSQLSENETFEQWKIRE